MGFFILAVASPAKAFFHSDDISKEALELVKKEFPFDAAISQLLFSNKDSIKEYYPTFNLINIKEHQSGSRTDVFMIGFDHKGALVINNVYINKKLRFTMLAKIRNNNIFQKLKKLSLDSEYELYFLGYYKKSGKTFRIILSSEEDRYLNSSTAELTIVME
ncbi:MAG: hypothetical protein NXI26_27380 [bacterium]|nr:hypothetical protein [bacterium]